MNRGIIIRSSQIEFHRIVIIFFRLHPLCGYECAVGHIEIHVDVHVCD